MSLNEEFYFIVMNYEGFIRMKWSVYIGIDLKFLIKKKNYVSDEVYGFLEGWVVDCYFLFLIS